MGNGLFGRHVAIGLAPTKVVAEQRAQPRHPRGASDEHELINIRGCHLYAGEHVAHRLEGSLKQRRDDLLESRSVHRERPRRRVSCWQLHVDDAGVAFLEHS
mmetsp:Transcript_39602/g.104535  ORF Transcript_39602/g.104535 Transcript_39602/m.104535 type:complete len:102 (+) Transcript_39602:389-694(+)